MNKKELNDMIAYEKLRTIGNMSLKHILKISLTRQAAWNRYKFVKYMRLANFYGNSVRGLYYSYLRNKYANILNYEITGKNIGKGLTLLHNGPIVIHGSAVLGENVIFHGNNCIGNNGISDECPIIGNNVDIGYGATIFGNIKIADNIRIGAGSVVVSSFLEPGITIVGIPAKKKGEKSEREKNDES